MTFFEAFQVVNAVVIVLAAAFAWSIRAGIKSGRWLSAGDAQTAQICMLKERMDKAGEKVSDLATFVQRLPDHWREEGDRRYMSAQVSEERWSEMRQKVSVLSERVRLVELDGARLLLTERIRQLELKNARGEREQHEQG